MHSRNVRMATSEFAFCGCVWRISILKECYGHANQQLNEIVSRVVKCAIGGGGETSRLNSLDESVWQQPNGIALHHSRQHRTLLTNGCVCRFMATS